MLLFHIHENLIDRQLTAKTQRFVIVKGNLQNAVFNSTPSETAILVAIIRCAAKIDLDGDIFTGNRKHFFGCI